MLLQTGVQARKQRCALNQWSVQPGERQFSAEQLTLLTPGLSLDLRSAHAQYSLLLRCSWFRFRPLIETPGVAAKLHTHSMPPG